LETSTPLARRSSKSAIVSSIAHLHDRHHKTSGVKSEDEERRTILTGKNIKDMRRIEICLLYLRWLNIKNIWIDMRMI
jgi:hypothetical protein